ncbi:uncharacterized protein LOC116247735 [Nymphaea colorata]|nr:uncharacterized protein LOC116247735 [Nymphaea colorata]XP_031475883.1 uncharacterized protein LOC116247735 [Nymphaea colorata]XP_031475884.1 uncharacterized protein LOC116247735 [Nymphaea colorata]XP_031475885.1 uncharacterized protein LOC116247735 [Nymphaea colorata]XP_049931955.1 uncharacterized protein LOC116247735 [Nymphaea colorata]
MQNGCVRDCDSLDSGELESILQALPAPLRRRDFQTLAEIAKTREGRSELSTVNPLPSLLTLVRFLLSHPGSDIIVPSLRLIRNLCAGDAQCQYSFVANGGADAVAVAVGCSESAEVVRFGFEVSANVASGGEMHRSVLWRALFPGGFKRGLCSFDDPRIADPACRILHVCVSEKNGRLVELCGLEGVPIMACLIRKSSKSDGVEAEWIQLLLQKICLEESCFSQLFAGLGTRGVSDYHENNISEGGYSVEQVYLLRAISEGLSQQGSDLVISKDVALSVFSIFRSAAELIRSSSTKEATSPTSSPTVDVLRHAILILRDVCSVEDRKGLPVEPSMLNVEDLQVEDPSTVDSLLSAGLVHFMLGLLQELGEPAIIRKAKNKSRSTGLGSVGNSNGQAAFQAPEGGEEASPLEPQLVCPYKGFRRDLVAVLGNSAYRRKHAQDEIRRQTGILLLLQQCVVDEDNPFLREWGIWTVRNLLEGNAENQREVAELKIQGSVDTPEISELGLQVKVDPETGRAKLVNVT